MKRISDLTRDEKITFLKMIQSGEVKSTELAQPVYFATQRGDAFNATLAIATGGAGSIVPLSNEAKEDLNELRKAMKP